MSGRKPLTLEELRQMVADDNDCIAFVVVHDVKGNYDVAAVLDEVFGDGICAVYSAGPVEYREKDYGKSWLAYATEAPRLDRSAWEPCGACKTTVDLSYWLGMSVMFCPHCGRPLTDAAWDILERRLAGHENQ